MCHAVDMLMILIGLRAALLWQWEPWERYAGMVVMGIGIAGFFVRS